MTTTRTYHGGDLQEAESLFGRPPEGWLDLSTGVNPLPYPHTETGNAAWARLPQAGPLDALLSAARRHYGVPARAAIAAGPGSQAILQHLPALFPSARVAVLGPTYAEHAKLWTAHGHAVDRVADLAGAGSADIAVLVNPNNPDGRRISPTELIAQSARRRLLVVDEAFADLDPETSVLPHMADESILSIRSFGKFFGLPGLRLGFAAGNPEIVAQLADRLGPWAVSGPALEIGARALEDEDWIAQTRRELAGRADALDRLLVAAGLQVIGGTALFRLVQDRRAPAIFKRLGAAGIFVRRFPERPEWLRFGVPGGDTDLRRLKRALG